MSPKQFIIIGVSAAAALLSNSPLVTAIGSVAQHNTPTDGYPPQDGGSGISLGGNFVTSVTYRTFWGGAGPVERGIEIRIVKSRLQTAWVRCPEAGNQEHWSGRDPLRVLKYDKEDYSIEDYCSTVKRALKNLWTFKDLCNEFHQEYDEAVKAANREMWQKKEDKFTNTTYYTPRK
ncbi:hypothetical protein FOZ61_007433 [Perkinsus olseni]|uniref:Uncharacterized protein n=1 Tax=Perkinsus olseni TaxID=32597 RepID=A0A7J6L913_PEROL|nr:hypothetical protein FOZ61_007433 [Perkinsus olseni]